MLITTAYALGFAEVARVVGQASPPGSTTATTTVGSPTITVGSSAGMATGQLIYGPGLSPGSVISNISGTTLTLNQNCWQTSAGATIYFQTQTVLTQLIQAAQAAIEKYIGWPTDQLSATEYYSGRNYPDLILRRPYVAASPAPVVNMDNVTGGYWGQAPGAFGTNTLLTQGQDWALLTEGSYNGIANAGLLRFLAGSGQGWGFGWWGGWGISGYGYGRSYLTPIGNRNPGWPIGQGNVQVTYTAGWLTGDAPLDLQQACVELVVFLARQIPTGGQQLTSESLGKYSYAVGAANMADVAGNAIAAAGELGTVRQLLVRYRDWNV